MISAYTIVVKPIKQNVKLRVMDLMLAVTSIDCTLELSDTLLANKLLEFSISALLCLARTISSSTHPQKNNKPSSISSQVA